jgi:tetratricopeptide (TPR) repeat protein
LARHARTYLLGLVNARLGDVEAALRHATTLQRTAEPMDSVGLLRDLALEIRALSSAVSGRPNEALSILEQMGLKVSSFHISPTLWFSRPFGRLLRAELLHRLGRHEEALRWFGGFPRFWASERAYLSHIYGRMAESYDALGDRERAIEYYNRFVARWKNADPGLQPRVEAARARLAELVVG